MTSVTQEERVASISQVDIPAWRGLKPRQRIEVRQAIQAVCSSGGVDQATLVDQIAQLFCEEDLVQERTEILILASTNPRMTDLQDYWEKERELHHLRDDLDGAERMAKTIIAQLIRAKFLVVNGDSIVICAGFPFKPASQV